VPVQPVSPRARKAVELRKRGPGSSLLGDEQIDFSAQTQEPYLRELIEVEEQPGMGSD
jgi:hypothetical protein